jgi:class 3 adenylate cyclase
LPAISSTRRLTAIVAADVAGYSRLISVDEEGTLSALRAHREELIDPKIEQYRGRIANTAGDSLLIEFPSVVDALRCTIDIQRGVAERNANIPKDRRIVFRAGVNLGDVIDQDGDLLGDGVNVAARLEGIAEAGGIYMSSAAFDQIQGRVDAGLEDLGEKSLKNIPNPVSVYRVLLDEPGTGPMVKARATSRFPRTSPNRRRSYGPNFRRRVAVR